LTRYRSYDDLALFRLIAEGDELAFTECFHRYTPLLHPYIYKLIHSELWAEDLLQNLFSKLWDNRAALKNVENPSAYLYRIAANLSFDFLKHHAVEVKAQYWLSRQLHQFNKDMGGEGIDFRMYERIVDEAVKNLSEQRRRVYLLKYEEGLSYEDIAQRLHISRNTVRNHLVESLQLIRDYLKRMAHLFFVAISFLIRSDL